MTFETMTLRLPAHWASFIFNGDSSGLSEPCMRECARWLLHLSDEGWRFTGTEEVEPWFAHSNDAGTLPCDVLTYELLREET